MPYTRPRQSDHSCNATCGFPHQSIGEASQASGDTQIRQYLNTTNQQRHALAMQHVQTLNQESASDPLTKILEGLQPVEALRLQPTHTATNEVGEQCSNQSTHEKSTFIVAPHTPRSAILLLNSIKALIERLTQNSNDTSAASRQKREELLERIANKLGIAKTKNLLLQLSPEWADNTEFLLTFDSIVKDQQNAEALGIQSTFAFNTANTGAEALADPRIQADFESLLNKLDGIPVHGVKQGDAKAFPALPETQGYGELRTFLANYTLPADKLLKKASTLIGALSFKSCEKEYTCLITMNSSKKRLGSAIQPDPAAPTTPQNPPDYPNSTNYIAYLNFTSNTSDHTQGSGEKLLYKAGAEAIIFNPPKKTAVSKDAFLDWILGASGLNEANAHERAKAPRLIHICAGDLIKFGMVETEEAKQPKRIVPRTGTGIAPKNTEPTIASSDKENHAPGSSHPDSTAAVMNHRIYDTEHMMLTLVHELSKHIANKDQADNTMEISLLSSYKACISCTRAITTLPFNENFKNLSRFFYLDTTAHDYRIEY